MTNQDHVFNILDDVLVLLSGQGFPTPERTYKLDGGWGLALSDLRRCFDNYRARIAELEAERDNAKSKELEVLRLRIAEVEGERDAAKAGEARAVEAIKGLLNELHEFDFEIDGSVEFFDSVQQCRDATDNTQPALDWLAQREREAAAEVWKTAIMLAHGCHDYGGGHFGEKYQAFQHGIDTVISVLEAKRDGDDSLQIKVVEHVGAAALRARKEVGE
jgi:hypothetical protein